MGCTTKLRVWLFGISILVLERDAADAFGLRTILEAAGAEVMFAFDVGEALVRLHRFDFDCAILDGIDCTEVCKALGGVPFMFYTKRGDGFPEWPEAPVLTKPATAKIILETVAKLAGLVATHGLICCCRPSENGRPPALPGRQ